jgi:hypothetical protein
MGSGATLGVAYDPGVLPEPARRLVDLSQHINCSVQFVQRHFCIAKVPPGDIGVFGTDKSHHNNDASC